MSRTARPFRGRKRSMARGRYQPARFLPSWTIHGQTAAGGAATVNARSITTSGRAMMSSPGRAARRSSGVAATEANTLAMTLGVVAHAGRVQGPQPQVPAPGFLVGLGQRPASGLDPQVGEGLGREGDRLAADQLQLGQLGPLAAQQVE